MYARRIAAVALTAAIGLLALSTPARADPWWEEAAAPAPAPSLTDASAAAQTPLLFTVDGTDFTAGGRVYLAIYDQMGARLYETRWVTASLVTTVLVHQPGDGSLGRSRVDVPGGALHEDFGQLCGATAMMRALDEATATWSNWLTVEPAACTIDLSSREQ
jgi:hypothetical protein